MDLTSPEHDALIALTERHARAGDTAVVAALTEAVRRTDAERYTVEAIGEVTMVVDRWQDGWIVDSYLTGRDAQLDANRRNTRNIRDGQAHLRERLARAGHPAVAL